MGEAIAATAREWPILFSSPMIRVILAGRKTVTRRVVAPSNSTVNGHPAGRSWSHLRLDLAQARGKSCLMVMLLGPDAAPRDVHLSVPSQHPDDPPEDDPADLPWHRVRPRWEPGDTLWVKETWTLIRPWTDADPGYVDDVEEWVGPLPKRLPDGWQVWYAADGDDITSHRDDRLVKRWRPSIFLPRWASRITLRVTEVRVERLQSIGEVDCEAELGVEPYSLGDGAYARFRDLWDELNGERAGCDWASSPWVWVVAFSREVADG